MLICFYMFAMERCTFHVSIPFMGNPLCFISVFQVVSACRETSGSLATLVHMMVQCSFCNKPFSTLVIRMVMVRNFKLQKKCIRCKVANRVWQLTSTVHFSVFFQTQYSSVPSNELKNLSHLLLELLVGFKLLPQCFN